MTAIQLTNGNYPVLDEIEINDTTNLGLKSWADGLAEWTSIKSIFLHRPGIETSLASLDFKTNLFLDVFYLEKAQEQHDNLRSTLRDLGIKVITSSQLVEHLSSDELTQFVKFNDRFEKKDQEDLIKNYIIDHKQLDMILTKPQISRKGEDELDMANSFTLSNPLGNFFYTRDPIFQTGADTFVVSNMKYHVRKREAKVAKLLFEKINHQDRSLTPQIRYSVPHSETIEGGEIVPIGDTMVIGVESHRTSIGAVYDLMKNNAVGHSNIGIVISPVKTQEEMHIDTWFNVIDEDLFVGANRFLDNHIDFLLYERDEDTGKYTRNKEINDFTNYLVKEREMTFLGLNNEEQRNLMSNGLTVSPRKYIMIDGKSTSSVYQKRLKEYGVDVVPVVLDELTDGHGGAHCMTQPISREMDKKYI